MKRILCFLLIVCCFVGILGCTSDNDKPENSVSVFFKREKTAYGTADGVIGETYLDAAGHEKQYAYLLNVYLRTTPGEGFSSPFPKGVTMIGFKLEGLTAKVVLSDQIAELTGMELTIALTCLTQTVMSMTGCQEIIISATTKQLGGQNFITLNRDSYLLIDDSGTA